MFYRANELTKTGLRLPSWLGLAVSFETRNRPQVYPATCRPVLAALDTLGFVGLREVMRWREDDLAPVLDAMQAIIGSSPQMLGFDINQLDKLGPLHRKLCRLSSGNRLGWIELTYFSKTEGLPLGDVRNLAKDLSGYGVLIPDPDSPPKDIELTELEVSALSDYFNETDKSPRLFRDFSYFYRRRTYESLFDLLRGLGDWDSPETNMHLGSDLSPIQEILLSQDLDGEPPFLKHITMQHLFKASRNRQFGTLLEAVGVARSLRDTGVDLGRAFSLNDGAIAQFDEVFTTDSTALTDGSVLVISRLFHALDHCRPVSVWDLALAADAAKIEPKDLRPVLDLIEDGGGDVAQCREFLAYCA